MTIKATVTVIDTNANPKFPVLRFHSGEAHKDHGSLVVLFTDEVHGIALSGVGPQRIGVREVWTAVTNRCWLPGVLLLKSED